MVKIKLIKTSRHKAVGTILVTHTAGGRSSEIFVTRMLGQRGELHLNIIKM